MLRVLVLLLPSVTLAIEGVVVRICVFALLVCCSFSAFAEEGSSPSRVVAERTVVQYKKLRKICAASVDQARADCFSELSKLNESYQSAKAVLARAKPAQAGNLHVVSGVN